MTLRLSYKTLFKQKYLLWDTLRKPVFLQGTVSSVSQLKGGKSEQLTLHSCIFLLPASRQQKFLWGQVVSEIME